MASQILLSTNWYEKNSEGKLCNDLINNFDNINKELLLKTAREELNETDELRIQCLEQFREWIKQNPDIEGALLDDNYLLKFLRVTKYSLFNAQQTFLKYLNFRKFFKSYIPNPDYRVGRVFELLKSGFIFPSPVRDSLGRRVVFYFTEKIDLTRHSVIDLGTTFAIAYEAIMDNQENQIFGLNHVADLNGITAGFTTLLTVSEFARILLWGEQSVPIRHKEINLINLPTPLRYVYNFAKTKLSKKINDRFKHHTSWPEFSETIDKRCLPLELGGVIPKKEMIRIWLEELESKRTKILALSEVNLLSDQGIICRKNFKKNSIDTDSVNGVNGSFRKLQVD